MNEEEKLTRRTFIRNTSILAVGALSGMGADSALALEPAGIREHSKILNYNPRMRYRRLGKTELMVSAVSLGGHWKRINVVGGNFEKNRLKVLSKCIHSGINYIDACTGKEVMAYAEVLRKIHKKIYFGYSWHEREVRYKGWRKSKQLLAGLDQGLKEAGLDYVDLWRITAKETGSSHRFRTSCYMVEALVKAKKQGKARFIGISSHDRRWLKMMIDYFPEIEVILMPYTSNSKVAPRDSIFESIRKTDVGVIGIKPFGGNSLFKGDSSPRGPHVQEDNRRARLAVRYILCNPYISTTIPGLITTAQVDNIIKAITERTTLDLKESAELKTASRHMWAALPEQYQWLRQWEYV